MLADELDYVLGFDTHRDEHVVAVVAAPAGAVIAGAAAAASGRGYRELLDRRLVTPRSRPLGSSLRATRGRRSRPASSGQTQRHRLSRGGDRQLNQALHTIVLHRRHHDPATRDYIARRIAEGKTRREATRLVKRYLARHLYRLLEAQEPLTA